jgi:hypothetical protein
MPLTNRKTCLNTAKVPKETKIHAESEILTAVVMSRSIFWDITQCSTLKVNWRFEGACCLHFQGWSVSQAKIRAWSRYQAAQVACESVGIWNKKGSWKPLALFATRFMVVSWIVYFVTLEWSWRVRSELHLTFSDPHRLVSQKTDLLELKLFIYSAIKSQ